MITAEPSRPSRPPPETAFPDRSAAPVPAPPAAAVPARAAGAVRANTGAVAVVALVVTLDLAAALPGTYAGRVLAAAFLLVVPGALLCALAGPRPHSAALRLAWAVGTSLLVLMAIGLAESLVLPHLGVTAPLRRPPLVAGVDLAVLGPLASPRVRRRPVAFLLGDVERVLGRDVATVTVLGALLPLAAAGGAERLNNGRGGAMAIAVAVVATVLLAATGIVHRRLPRYVPGVVLFGAAASFLLLLSMRSDHPYGYDIQAEFQVLTSTLQRGAWTVPAHGNAYAAMLSVTVLPSVLSTVSGLAPVTVLKAIFPLVLALFPVLVAVTARRFLPWPAAYTAAALLVAQGLLAADLTGIARQEIALCFFGVLVATVVAHEVPLAVRRGAVVTAMTGMAVTHYSTAYFALVVLAGGYAVARATGLARRTWRHRSVVTVAVLAASFGVVALWNVGVTRSAGNVADLARSLASSGPDLLPSTAGGSLLQRFLAADVTPTVSARQFGELASRYYEHAAPYLQPYPAALVARYPLRAAPATGGGGSAAAALGNLATVASELLLVLTVVGAVTFFWRSRRSAARSEVGALAVACLALVGSLRLSGTLSSLYNAPRAQVQAGALLGLGTASVLAWLGDRRRTARLAEVGAAVTVGFLALSGSGLLALWSGGGAPDRFTNRGEAYARSYITDADLASARWVLEHRQPGQVVFADTYAALQLRELAAPRAVVTAVVPSVLTPGAFVYASATNLSTGVARSEVDGRFASYAMPTAFLGATKDVVFTTGTTTVYR